MGSRFEPDFPLFFKTPFVPQREGKGRGEKVRKGNKTEISTPDLISPVKSKNLFKALSTRRGSFSPPCLLLKARKNMSPHPPMFLENPGSVGVEKRMIFLPCMLSLQQSGQKERDKMESPIRAGNLRRERLLQKP